MRARCGSPPPSQVPRVALVLCPTRLSSSQADMPSRLPRRSRQVPRLLLHAHRCPPSRDAQTLGLRIDGSRGSFGFTSVTACRFATVAERRLNPTYLNAPVARTRPVGRYTLNRQFAWEAPFILQDDKHLLSAYRELRKGRADGKFARESRIDWQSQAFNGFIAAQL